MPTVVVVGGGFAGLATAFKLVKFGGFRIIVLEAESELGGKARGWIQEKPDGTRVAVEHSMRVYMSAYVTLMAMLKEVALTMPVNEVLIPHCVSMDYLQTGNSPPIGASALMSHYNVGFWTMLKTFVLQAVRRPNLDEVSMKEWCQLAGIDEGSQRFIWAVMGVWTGAKPESRASVILGGTTGIALCAMLRDKPAKGSARGTCDASSADGARRPTGGWHDSLLRMSLFGGRENHLMMMYPTNTRVIEPLTEWLLERGVEFRTGIRVVELQEAMGRHPRHASAISVEVSDTGDALPNIEADAFVFAVDAGSSQRLFPEVWRQSGVEGALHEVGEWSVGCSFSLSLQDLPAHMRGHKGPRMVLESPWHVAYAAVLREEFPSCACPTSQVTLFVTCSNLNSHPGVLFGKQALLCTPEELKQEFLEQAGFQTANQMDVSRAGSVGLGVQYLSRADVERTPWRYRDHVFGPVVEESDGYRWVAKSCLFIEQPGTPKITTETEVQNVFLAGEYISSHLTEIKVPTMEKSAETGVLAAQAVRRFLSSAV